MRTIPAEVEALLESEPLMAHLATSVNDRPHVAPVWYRYADGTIEVLTTGTKLANVRENPRVAMSIQKDEGGRARWAVTLRGIATVIDDENALREAAQRINPKYGAGPDVWSNNTLVRIEVGSVAYETYRGDATPD